MQTGRSVGGVALALLCVHALPACASPEFCAIDDNRVGDSATITQQNDTYELVKTPQSATVLQLETVSVHMATEQLAQLKLGVYGHNAANPNDNPDLEGPVAGVFATNDLGATDPNTTVLFDFSKDGVSVASQTAYFFLLVLDGYAPVQISINSGSPVSNVLQSRTTYNTWGPSGPPNARLSMDIRYSHLCSPN